MGCTQASAAKGNDNVRTSNTRVDREQDKKAAKEENKGYQQTMQFLSKVMLFKKLPKHQHPLLAAACQPAEYKVGQVVISQGDAGAEFFVIRRGQASISITKDNKTTKVATLKEGDYFGENALLREEPRSATITAETPLSCLKITREKFQELGLHEQLQFANRKAVGAGGRRQVATKPPSPKTPQETALIKDALLQNMNLQTMLKLDEARLEAVLAVLWKEVVPAGTELIREGDMTADYFYVVQDGSFDVYISDQGEEPGGGSGESKYVSSIGAGGSFGELALLYLVPRAATIKAAENSVVWIIDRGNFKDILMKVSNEKIKEYVKYLNRVEVLHPLLAAEKKALAQALVEMHFTKDEAILQQGEAGNTFYVLYEGEVAVVKDGKEQVRLRASQAGGTAEVFGERALLNNEPRAASIVVVSSTAKALALDRDSFNMLLGPLQDIIKRGGDPQANPELPQVAGGNRFANPKNQLLTGADKILRKDLSRIGLLGCGGFGAVELWEHKKTGDSYALKGLSKGHIVKTGMQESVMNEKNILMMTNSPFIIRLYATYNGSQTLYFLLEPALGGELYSTYNRKGLHGSEKHAKYYIAGVVFAFEHCHERHIIYRDLKPENLLFTEKGHLKVTDMGLAKFVIGKTFTTCGTPDYFAPEIISSTGHTNAVDWWTLGILLFELLSGHPPFESAYPMQIYSKVMKGIGKVAFPAKCGGAAEVLIKGLLHKDPSDRLPMRPGGLKNLKETKWYAGFDWEAMRRLELDPPYKPTVKSKTDIANFHARKEDMPAAVPYTDDGSGWDKDFAT